MFGLISLFQSKSASARAKRWASPGQRAKHSCRRYREAVWAVAGNAHRSPLEILGPGQRSNDLVFNSHRIGPIVVAETYPDSLRTQFRLLRISFAAILVIA